MKMKLERLKCLVQKSGETLIKNQGVPRKWRNDLASPRVNKVLMLESAYPTRWCKVFHLPY